MFLQRVFYQQAEWRSITFTRGMGGAYLQSITGEGITGSMGPQTPLKMITMNTGGVRSGDIAPFISTYHHIITVASDIAQFY